jgi:hypothetical protein
MTRYARGLTAAVLAVVVAAAGCRSHPVAAEKPFEKCQPVVFDGCGVSAKRVEVTPERLTLRDAFAGLDVEPVLNAGGYPVLIFVRLVRPDGDYFIATELVPDTPVGDILLYPGERIELVPWTGTDLKRGLNEVSPPAVGPAPQYAGSLRPLFEWYAKLPNTVPITKFDREEFEKLMNDEERRTWMEANIFVIPGPNPTTFAQYVEWSRRFEAKARRDALQERPTLVFSADLAYLQSLYGARLRGRESIKLNVVGLDSSGRKQSDPTYDLVESAMVTSSLASRRMPRIGNFRRISTSPVDVTTGRPLDIEVVERTVDGQPMVFMLPLPRPSDPKVKVDPSAPVISDVMENALVFDGDVITIAPPESFPIVTASQLVSQQVVQPIVQRRKLAERKCPKPGLLPAQTDRGGFRIFQERLMLIGERNEAGVPAGPAPRNGGPGDYFFLPSSFFGRSASSSRTPW